VFVEQSRATVRPILRLSNAVAPLAPINDVPTIPRALSVKSFFCAFVCDEVVHEAAISTGDKTSITIIRDTIDFINPFPCFRGGLFCPDLSLVEVVLVDVARDRHDQDYTHNKFCLETDEH
jgi:hypothetical protein